MIISLEILDSQLEAQSQGEIEDFFSEILRSSRRGHHIVIIPRSLARWALDNLQLSGPDQAHLEKVREEFTQLGSLRSDPTSKVLKIVSFAQALQEISDNTWSIGIKEIVSSRFLDKPVLLLENATNDGELYKKLLTHHSRRRNVKNLAFQIANGGGGTTFQEVIRFAGLENIVVCVCDHDKLSPASAKAETFRKAEAAALGIDFVGTIVATPGREIENFLPLSLLVDLFPDYSSVHCLKLEELLAAQGDAPAGDCLWLYFDVKEGISAGKLDTKCVSDASRLWVQQKYNIEDLADGEIEITGFGQHVVNRLLDSGAGLSALHRFTRSEYWIKHFEAWFDALIAFLHSRPVSRI